jgi:hypothetical protein
MAYPTNADPAIWQVALVAIGGKFDGTAETLYELWDFAGYVAGQAFPYSPASATRAAPKLDFNTIPLVEKFKAVKAFNWGGLLALLIPILEKLVTVLVPAVA